MSFAYLGVLLVSFSGIAVLDWRYRLAWFYDKRRTMLVIATCVVVFSVWDAFGIALGIFFSGHSPYMSGVYLAPEYPLEELLFLGFLGYFTLVMYRLFEEKA
jgi:lycopene cyclase domain-containing protein